MSGVHSKDEAVATPALFDDGSERAVLGCLLNHPAETVALVGLHLQASLFFSPPCRTIFEGMLALLDQHEPLELSTLTCHLRERGELDNVGGAYALTQLCTTHACGLPAVEYHLDTLREHAAARLALQASVRLSELAYNRSVPTAEIVEEMVRSTEAVRALEQASADRRAPLLEFLSPSQLRAFEPPAGWNLVGDYHLQRTSAFVIGGPPGTGKSRALTFLAAAGATGSPFFGLPVHRHFKTMILQCENGRVRLKNELAALGSELDPYIRFSPPPPLGFAFSDPRFLAELRAAIEEFEPDVFALDPWNRLARDDRGKDYKEAFDAILSVLPAGDACPAIGIVAHTRKPQAGERADGRALLNLLAGSYILGSVPRSVFILQPASDEGQDDRVVWTCAKNNDGALGERSAWIRQNGLFAPCPDFDWNEFNQPSGAGEERGAVTEEHLEAVFEKGKAALSLAEAKRRLEALTGCKKTACYTALKPDGRFAGRLTENAGILRWK